MKNWKGFERLVAKMIVETFKDYGITTKDAYRTPMSGGHQYASKTDAGDIVISPKLRKLFPWSVECKAWATVRLDQFLYPMKLWKKSWKCKKWLAQVKAAAEKQEGDLVFPLLVFKENNGEILAAFPATPGEGVGTIAFKARVLFEYEGHEWMVVRFKSFLRKVRVHCDSQSQFLRNSNRRREA